MQPGHSALEELFDAFEELRATLDEADAVAIEAASRRIGQAATAVRAIGAWRSAPEIRARLDAMLPLIESARIRINLLTDHANQKLAMLASHGSHHAPLTYGR